MQKSLVWKGFLSESKQVEDYRNLSIFNKLAFWADYPHSYAIYLRVVLWDRVDRLCFRDSRTGSTKTGIEIIEMTESKLKKAYGKLTIFF